MYSGPTDKPLVWLHGEVKTPPLSTAARIEAGVLLRRLQRPAGCFSEVYTANAAARHRRLSAAIEAI
jgi:hypothetical protein